MRNESIRIIVVRETLWFASICARFSRCVGRCSYVHVLINPGARVCLAQHKKFIIIIIIISLSARDPSKPEQNIRTLTGIRFQSSFFLSDSEERVKTQDSYYRICANLIS